jgi:hypothetical protein
MLKLDEITSPTGALIPVFLRVNEGQLEIVAGSEALRVPQGALEAVLRRYGAPFDPSARISRVGRLELAHDRTLEHVRHLAGYDVIARDYLVYSAATLPEPLCALATTVTAALTHLARASATSP